MFAFFLKNYSKTIFFGLLIGLFGVSFMADAPAAPAATPPAATPAPAVSVSMPADFATTLKKIELRKVLPQGGSTAGTANEVANATSAANLQNDITSLVGDLNKAIAAKDTAKLSDLTVMGLTKFNELSRITSMLADEDMNRINEINSKYTAETLKKNASLRELLDQQGVPHAGKRIVDGDYVVERRFDSTDMSVPAFAGLMSFCSGFFVILVGVTVYLVQNKFYDAKARTALNNILDKVSVVKRELQRSIADLVKSQEKTQLSGGDLDSNLLNQMEKSEDLLAKMDKLSEIIGNSIDASSAEAQKLLVNQILVTLEEVEKEHALDPSPGKIALPSSWNSLKNSLIANKPAKFFSIGQDKQALNLNVTPERYESEVMPDPSYSQIKRRAGTRVSDYDSGRQVDADEQFKRWLSSQGIENVDPQDNVASRWSVAAGAVMQPSGNQGTARIQRRPQRTANTRDKQARI